MEEELSGDLFVLVSEMFDHYPLDFVYWYEVEKELLPWKMNVALPWIFWMFSTACMRTLEKLIMITLTVCKTNDMSCFYLTACRYQSWVWNISVSCLSSQPCVLSGNFLTWCFLSLSTEWTESRLICLVHVPLELIIFFCLRIGRMVSQFSQPLWIYLVG